MAIKRRNMFANSSSFFFLDMTLTLATWKLSTSYPPINIQRSKLYVKIYLNDHISRSKKVLILCLFLLQGYLFISVLVNTNSDLIRLIIQSIKNDLTARNPVHVNLALQCIANIGSREMAEAFSTDIPRLLVSG
jgi:hypothetical protein